MLSLLGCSGIKQCVELAKATRPPTISKAKAKSATIGRNKGKELAMVTEYEESSVDDISLREDITRGYEDFKVRAAFNSLHRLTRNSSNAAQ